MNADLEATIQSRRSIRRFLPAPVPHAELLEALRIAQRAPSNSNIQPWRLVFAEGAARERLAQALLHAARTDPRPTAPLPPTFQAHRAELGAMVYGAMGISREDKTARAAAVRRNYDFFGAPVVGIVCMHRELGSVDAVGVGMYLQTFVLALTARGIGTCVQAALATYADVIREVLKIPDELSILCGLSLGFADATFAANQVVTPRGPLEEQADFLSS